MKQQRCPYHVKQGIVNAEGKLVLNDVCGVKSACGGACTYHPFQSAEFKSCPRLLMQQRGQERHVLVPKEDLEYAFDKGGFSGISELELM